jgi:MoxR-like ATPase
MSELLYREEPPAAKPRPHELAAPLLAQADDPAGYLPDQGLVDAVNVALLLRQPLLLTGEPGTGKSQLAASVAYQLGLDLPIVFETKSTSVARDLFYHFDNIGRFRAAQTPGAAADPVLFLTLNALGLAIVLANPPDDVSHVLPPDFHHEGQRQSIVLIDEIDKAPRDFPNDILNEIERLFFRIPELGEVMVKAQPSLRPIVVMTSNSEKSLPDAFLRRCIFYSIPFPDDVRLERIILSRLPGRVESNAELLRDSIGFFTRIRQADLDLRKRPGTAELLNWIAAMLNFGCDPANPLAPQAASVVRTLATLSKSVEDQEHVMDAFRRWVYAQAET